ncbi:MULTISPECIES: DUF3789 domain-containing protein [Fictibacillus]|uniref:DUF3789 domain-containing protein n=1 Tax=Fictibacillus terranigra TaxID=3058424 RepID=A0ABT8E1Y2_9BACL|nr:DUF3789 domain-containing protein [Fictibacillus sp. CENA-BCM004]MDN4071933.1 DUF3789 domain-containing protein [Fictibacillus sp. CENA-BCM004]
MLMFIAGCFVGSILTVFIMSLMIVSKRADETSEKQYKDKE